MLDAIRVRVQASSQRKVGEEVGLSPAYLSDILLGRRVVSDRVAAVFGFSRHVETMVYYKRLVTENGVTKEVDGG